MKLKFFLLLGCGLLAGIGSQAQQEVWDSYMAAYPGGATGSVAVNMALKQQAPLKDYPYVMMVAVNIKNCGADGFPNEGELPKLAGITDTVRAVMKRTKQSVPVGSFMYKCQRQEFYYVHDTLAVRAAIATAFSKYFAEYTIDIKMKEDAGWRMYQDFLYPSEQMQDYMKNQKLVMQLQARGDNLTAERLIEHWLYFATREDRERFITYAKGANFTIDDKKTSEANRMEFELKISRVEKVSLEDISKTTWELQQQAKLNNGEYDGWQSHVIK